MSTICRLPAPEFHRCDRCEYTATADGFKNDFSLVDVARQLAHFLPSLTGEEIFNA